LEADSVNEDDFVKIAMAIHDRYEEMYGLAETDSTGTKRYGVNTVLINLDKLAEQVAAADPNNPGMLEGGLLVSGSKPVAELAVELYDLWKKGYDIAGSIAFHSVSGSKSPRSWTLAASEEPWATIPLQQELYRIDPSKRPV
jgi:hypothetical protein